MYSKKKITFGRCVNLIPHASKKKDCVVFDELEFLLSSRSTVPDFVIFSVLLAVTLEVVRHYLLLKRKQFDQDPFNVFGR